MRPAVIMMFRNEADILSQTLHHWYNLGIRDFYLVDNGSTDGSRLCAEQFASMGVANVHIWFDTTTDFQQKAICNNLKNRAIADGCDWIFPIDADEQICFDSGINKYAYFGNVRTKYGNLIEYLEGLERRTDTHFCAFEIRYKDNFPAKIGMACKWHEPQRKVFGRFPASWILSYGNHVIENTMCIELNDIWYEHYPVRSYEQFKSKATAYMEAFHQNPDMKNHPHTRNYHLWQQQGEPFIQQLYDTCLATLQWPPE